MSEPVSNVEIEDVLSSIRRLVSEEHRSELRPRPKETPVKNSRLVLTPALRVADFPESVAEPEQDVSPDHEQVAEQPPQFESVRDSSPESSSDFSPEYASESAPELRSDSEPVPEPEFAADLRLRAEPEVAEVAEAEVVDKGVAEPDWADTQEPALAEDLGKIEEPAQIEADAEIPDAPQVEMQIEAKADSHPVAEQERRTNSAPLWLLPESELAVGSKPHSPLQDEVSDGDHNEAPWRDPEATLFEAAQSLSADQPNENAASQDGGFTTEDTPTDPWPDIEDVDLADTDQPDLEDMAEDLSVDLPPIETAENWPTEAAEESPVIEPAETPDEPRAERENPSDPEGEAADDAWHNPTNAQEEGTEFVRTAALSAKIAALEATIGRTQDQWEPDGEVGDDYAGTKVETIEWQDHDADEDAKVESLRPVSQHPNADTPFQDSQTIDPLETLASDEAFLDEESLRELVADIVRQELQGALGERITRNVRKLVRREIHRALTAQELD